MSLKILEIQMKMLVNNIIYDVRSLENIRFENIIVLQEENEDTPPYISGPVPVGIRPPWVPVFPYRAPIPPPMVFLPRPPFIPSVGVYPHHPPPLRPIRLIHRPPPPGMFIPGMSK